MLDVAVRLIDPAVAASALLRRFELTGQQAIDLGHGKRIESPEDAAQAGPVAAIAPSGRLVGLVEFRGTQGRSVVNFPEDEVAAQEGTE